MPVLYLEDKNPAPASDWVSRASRSSETSCSRWSSGSRVPRLPGSDGRLGLAPPTASACHATPPSCSDLSGTCGPKYLGIKDLSRFEKGKRDRKKVLVRKLAHSMGLCQYVFQKFFFSMPLKLINLSGIVMANLSFQKFSRFLSQIIDYQKL